MHKHTYSKSWPSFFIAEPGTCSSLHVDQVHYSRIAYARTRESTAPHSTLQWNASFWMVMVTGRKKWILFDREV
jgi:hypothetical protein